MDNLQDYNNTVIKVLNDKHGKEVIEFWQSVGINTCSYKGDGFVLCEYYGLIDNRFDNYNFKQVQNANAKIIELPYYYEVPDMSNGIEMMVSNDKLIWEKRLVACKINGFYHTSQVPSRLLTEWKYIKFIKPS